MAAIEFNCPACQATLRLGNPALAGKKIKCPKCGAVVTVPAPAEPELPMMELAEPEMLEPEPVPAAIRPAGRRPPAPADEDEAPPSRGPRRGEEDDEDAPRPRRRRQQQQVSQAPSRNALIIGGIVLAVSLCGGCVGVVWWAISAASNAANDLAKDMRKDVRKDKDKEFVPKQQDGQPKDKDFIYDVGPAGVNIMDRLAVTDSRDVRGGADKCYCKVYRVRMSRGKSYTIRMNAPPGKMLDPYLRLENAALQTLAENDDAPGEQTLNSRIDFFCPSDGVHRIIATSLQDNQTGPFTLSITAR